MFLSTWPIYSGWGAWSSGSDQFVNWPTERKIQDALNYLTKGKTTLVIAHRLSTILNSYKIYVIDNGEVVAKGNHKELLENSKVYKNFYEKQIQKS